MSQHFWNFLLVKSKPTMLPQGANLKQRSTFFALNIHKTTKRKLTDQGKSIHFNHPLLGNSTNYYRLINLKKNMFKKKKIFAHFLPSKASFCLVWFPLNPHNISIKPQHWKVTMLFLILAICCYSVWNWLLHHIRKAKTINSCKSSLRTSFLNLEQIVQPHYWLI